MNMSRFIPLLATMLLSLQALAHNHELSFIKNGGQWPAQVNFMSKVAGGQIWLENNKISYQFVKYPNLHANFNSDEEPIVKQHVVWANFKGANANYTLEQKDASKEYYNYFIGNDESKWASGMHSYGDIRYKNLYNFTDLRIYEDHGHMKYDFILHPGAKNAIQVAYEGQDKMEINKAGELVIYTSLGQLIEEKPYAYQVIDGKKKEVKCKFVLKDNVLSFSLGGYNKNLDLIIDPVLIFASYNGSPSDNFGMTATYDEGGNLYTGGIVYGANYPTTPGVFDPVGTFPATVPSSANAPVYGITDVYVTKFEPNGTSLVYSTYIGGGDQFGGTEAVHSLICDSLGNLHMYGTTSSSDFPITGTAYQNTWAGGARQLFQFNGIDYIATGGIGNGGGSDIFVTKLDAAGANLLGSTYIGGSGNDGLNYQTSGGSYNSVAAYDSLTNNYGDQFRGEIMIDDSGYVYIASSTHSTDFPIVGGFQAVSGGYQEAIVCKFSPNLDNLIWSSYIGGAEKDAGYSVKVDHNYDVIVSGGTCSNTFPTTPGSINPVYLGGEADGFVTKIAANGGSIISSTFMGTNVYDQCYFVEVDRFGSLYIVGQTQGNFTIFNAPYNDPNSGNFIVKMDSNLTTVIYSTIFGNGNLNSEFSPSAFLVDRCLNVYVSGWGGNILGSNSLMGMPITTSQITSATNDIINTTAGDGFNFYLTVLERDMQSQLFGIYYGGGTSREHVDGGTSRFDKNGIIYQSVCAGCGNNDDFPTTTGAWSNVNLSSNCNNGVFKFDFEIIPEAQFSVDNFQGCAPLTVTFTNTSGQSDSYLWDFGGGDTTSQIFNPVKTYNTPGTYNVTLLITDSICNTVDTAFQTITVAPPVTITGGDTIATCDTATLNISTTGGPASIIWSSNNQFSDTLNPGLLDSSLFVTITDTTWFYVFAGDSLCFALDSFRVDYLGFTIVAYDTATCAGEQTQIRSTHNSPTSLTYSWTPVGSIISGASTASPTVNPLASTTYTVTATNTFGCMATDTARVIVSGFDPNNINVWADNDSIFGQGGTYLHVTPNTGFTYVWSPPLNLDNPTSPNPFFTPTFPSVTTFTVILTENSSGCEYRRQITIYAFEVNCGPPDVFIPNAFTPNNDGENDMIFVRGKNVAEMVLKIYNRWGELVFETTDQTKGWDGTYKGKLVDPGVFVYYLDLICVDGQENFLKGNITVIR